MKSYRAGMGRLFDVVTFDCYGTLIDWERGIGEAFGGAAEACGETLDRAAALQAYAEREPVVEAEVYRSYRMAESLLDWPPFSDTNPALEMLAAGGCRLGILSNVDDDLLAGTLSHLTVRFDLLVTAQQVGSYKPARGHFLTARERIGGSRWLHAAQSYFHDVAPALALGIPVAWINRKREPAPDGVNVDRVFHALTELADWLA